MKHPAFVILPVVLVLFTGHMQQAAAQTDDVAASQKLELTPAERSAIYATVSKDKSCDCQQRQEQGRTAAVLHQDRR
jgi:hypothetical protein